MLRRIVSVEPLLLARTIGDISLLGHPGSALRGEVLPLQEIRLGPTHSRGSLQMLCSQILYGLLGQLHGLVKLAIDSMNPAYGSSNSLGATPAFVMAAITDALSHMPGDKFLKGLQSYNASTNVMSLLLSDNTTVDIDMTSLLADAIASIPDATATIRGLVKLATAAQYPSSSDTLTVTPA